jgi:hypothetical protein
MHKLTGFLYARPSLFEGVSRLIDFGDTLQIYNTALSPDQSDFLALASDWQVIGDDLREAIKHHDDLPLSSTDKLVREARQAIYADTE